MQLEDAAIRPLLHADIVAAWDVEELRPDRQRVQNASDQLPKARVELQGGSSQPTAGAAASREALLPHTYQITGTFAYPAPGSDVTINELCVEKVNALLARLTAEYPFYSDWRYSEEVGWDWEDNAEERVYSVVIVFTLEVISRVQTV